MEDRVDECGGYRANKERGGCCLSLDFVGGGCMLLDLSRDKRFERKFGAPKVINEKH